MDVMTKGVAAVVLATAGVVFAAPPTPTAPPSSGYFSWDVNRTIASEPDFTPSPVLTDDNVNQVQNRLAAAQAAGQPLAVKVTSTLSANTINAIFNNAALPVQFVFLDFEGQNGTPLTATQTFIQSIKNTASKGAFVGNFNFYPGAETDPTRPSNRGTVAQSFKNAPGSYKDQLDGPSTGTNPGTTTPPTKGGTKTPSAKGGTSSKGGTPAKGGGNGGGVGSGNNSSPTHLMSNEALYPGAPDYTGASFSHPGSPNIRSALFTQPIQRETLAESGLPAGDAHIPWVTRFNNYGNDSLNSGGNGRFDYRFVQNASTLSNPNDPSTGQLPSRGDFEAQLLHYRLRGADSVNLFQTGVVGYTDAQARDDVRNGFSGESNSFLNNIFSGNYTLANLTNNIQTPSGRGDGFVQHTMAALGAAWSGVFNTPTKPANGQGASLVVLLSNLRDDALTIDLPKIGGKPTSGGDGTGDNDDYTLAPGTHRLLEFTLSKNGKKWQLLDGGNLSVFTDNDRSGVGVPEPTSLTVLGLAGLGLLARRRRSGAAV